MSTSSFGRYLLIGVVIVLMIIVLVLLMAFEVDQVSADYSGGNQDSPVPGPVVLDPRWKPSNPILNGEYPDYMAMAGEDVQVYFLGQHFGGGCVNWDRCIFKANREMIGALANPYLSGQAVFKTQSNGIEWRLERTFMAVTSADQIEAKTEEDGFHFIYKNTIVTFWKIEWMYDSLITPSWQYVNGYDMRIQVYREDHLEIQAGGQWMIDQLLDDEAEFVEFKSIQYGHTTTYHRENVYATTPGEMAGLMRGEGINLYSCNYNADTCTLITYEAIAYE